MDKMKTRCSFCGRSEDDKSVEIIIHGESANICNKCLDRCNETLFLHTLENKIEEYLKKIGFIKDEKEN